MGSENLTTKPYRKSIVLTESGEVVIAVDLKDTANPPTKTYGTVTLLIRKDVANWMDSAGNVLMPTSDALKSLGAQLLAEFDSQIIALDVANKIKVGM